MSITSDLIATANSGIWTDSEMLECCAVVPEAPDTVTISFVSPSGNLFKYEPGQFLTLELPVPGGPLYRTYTISSSPSRPLSLSITVKAQPGSIGTRWMLEKLMPGMRVKAIGPAGQFTLDTTAGKKKYLFISAGSGVTPTLAMTTYLYDRGTDIDVSIINCARRPGEIIGRRSLAAMASRVPSIKLTFIVEEDDPFQVWTGLRGRLNQIMIGIVAGDYLERDIYCCGPEPFMDAVREMLIGLGYDLARYSQESFSAPAETAEDVPDLDDVTPDESVAAQITFVGSKVTAGCTETDTVLAVARGAGLNIPSGCTFGVCGTCKIRKTKGEVHMVQNGGISEDDIADGYILACCSKPVGQVEVDV